VFLIVSDQLHNSIRGLVHSDVPLLLALRKQDRVFLLGLHPEHLVHVDVNNNVRTMSLQSDKGCHRKHPPCCSVSFQHLGQYFEQDEKGGREGRRGAFLRLLSSSAFFARVIIPHLNR
jgi:hypothetical protein